MSFPNAHIFPKTADINSDSHLTLGGCDIVELAEEFGTPLYVFDETTLRDTCREFVTEFRARHANSTVIYACKAFVNVPLAQLLEEEGLGLDVVSGGELAVARRIEFPPGKVYFHGNNKSREELEMALDYGIGRVVVDNFHELALLSEIAAARGAAQDIMLRVSPGVDPSHPRLHHNRRLGQQVRLSHPDRPGQGGRRAGDGPGQPSTPGAALPPGVAHFRA